MIKRIRALILCALLLCIAGIAGAEEVNLLQNPGFEQLDSNGLPVGWFTDAYIKREGVSEYTVTEAAKSGNSAVTVENFDLNDARFAQTIQVEPNTMYRLSGWIRAAGIDAVGHGANLSIEGVHARSDSFRETNGTWEYVETYGVTGDEQTEVTVFVRVGGYSGESIGVASFDDLSLVEVDELPSGVFAEAWYAISEPQVIAPVDQNSTAEASPAWPWLIVVAAVYSAFAMLLMQQMQLDRQEAALIERNREPGTLRMPAFVFVGLCFAMLARIITALNVEGYQVDVNCFTAWGNTMSSVGPSLFYQSNWCDYTPGYIYVMGLNGWLSKLAGGLVSAAFVHKLIPMACDLIAAWLIYRLAVENNYTRRQAGMLALLFAFNPAPFLNSAAWCQVDSVLSVGLMLVAYLAIHRKWAIVLPLYVLCILVKPQALMLGFLGLAAIVMELVKHHDDRDLWKQMGIGLLISLALALLIIIPFCPNQESPWWLIGLYANTLASYPYATVNTANLYYLAGGNWDGIANLANDVACIVLLLTAIAWAAYSFIRRRDKRITLIEPLVTATVPLLLVCLYLLDISWYHFDAPFFERLQLVLTDRFVFSGNGISFELTGLALAITAVLLLAASIGLIAVLIRKRRWCSGLVETALMSLFALAYAGMIVFDTTWSILGIVAMAMAFAMVLPMFIRSGKMENLPLCGAVIFLLLYVFGIKMHERYLFPAIFLLGMAYAIRRDRRILGLLIGTSCVLFINEGIVLDNSIRLGSSMGHLNQDTTALANLLSVLNVAFALLSVWTCHRVCVDDAPVRLHEQPPAPMLPVREYESSPCTPLNFKADAKLGIKRVDVLLMLVVTLIYSVVTLTTLGSTKAPQTAWKSSAADERVYIDLGQRYEDFSMLYFAQVSYKDFAVEVRENDQFALASDDAEADDGWSEAYPAEMREGMCFSWQYLDPSYTSGGEEKFVDASDFSSVQKLTGRYVCIIPRQYGLVLNEILFKDADGNIITGATIIARENANDRSSNYSDPENLLDEQDTLEGEPGWWNSTYFDEIYHARTAYELLHDQEVYEWTHPPLGKIIMSWFVGLFGMTPFGWRFAGALCGILMLPAMYLLVKQMTKRSDMAFYGMMLMTLDCMHFTQTRLATIDSYPVLFIILSYFFMLRFMQQDIVLEDVKKLLPDLAFSGFFMGCGFASKWIGAYAGIGLAILFFWTCLRHIRMGKAAEVMLESERALTAEANELLSKRAKCSLRRAIVLCAWCLLFFVAIPLTIYLLSYADRYAVREFTGISDFLKTLWQENFGKYNSMLSYHGTPGLGMDHYYYSPWYEWPLMIKPMYYASAAFKPEGETYAIFCFGNPWVWVVGLVGIAYTVYYWAQGHCYRNTGKEGTWQLFRSEWDAVPAFVLIGLLAQFLPWVLVPRGTYIYHYFASIPFLMLGTVLMVHHITLRKPKFGRTLLWGHLILCLVWFVMLFPYASGVMTPNGWMDFIRDYPYISLLPDYWKHDWLVNINTFLEKIPIFPHVYHH